MYHINIYDKRVGQTVYQFVLNHIWKNYGKGLRRHSSGLHTIFPHICEFSHALSYW